MKRFNASLGVILLIMNGWGCQSTSNNTSPQQEEEKKTQKIDQTIQRNNPALTQSQPVDVQFRNHPKNIILLIGDGMGIAQITSGIIAKRDALNLEKFQHIGLVKVFSSDNLITDSAAGATAFATGNKTYNGAIGVDTDTNKVTTILEQAESKGLATGLIATSSITHATPAAFISHQPDREMHEAIAADFLQTPVDLFMGGGKQYFQKREDGQNLLKTLRKKGYTVREKVPSAQQYNPPSSSKLAVLIAQDHPKRVSKGRGNFLTEASQVALKQLKQNKKGFFLMIEGSQIDWGGHEREAKYIKNEMLDFDKTIGKVLEFARQDTQTLVLVTADHECGGFAMEMDKKQKTQQVEGDFTTDYHTAEMVPIFAYGPGAKQFQGIQDNTSIYYKMSQALQLTISN